MFCTQVDDLCAEFAAIKCMPLGDQTYFNHSIRPAFTGGRHRAFFSALPLLYALRAVLIRHTQEQRLDGEAVLALPPKTDEVVMGE